MYCTKKYVITSVLPKLHMLRLVRKFCPEVIHQILHIHTHFLLKHIETSPVHYNNFLLLSESFRIFFTIILNSFTTISASFQYAKDEPSASSGACSRNGAWACLAIPAEGTAHKRRGRNILKTRTFALRFRVARWYIFKPKMPIWINFGGPGNGRCWYV
jgi:hypothetical protein